MVLANGSLYMGLENSEHGLETPPGSREAVSEPPGAILCPYHMGAPGKQEVDLSRSSYHPLDGCVCRCWGLRRLGGALKWRGPEVISRGAHLLGSP